MATNDKNLVPVFIPPLALLLERAEDLKGSPLTPEEVFEIRDKAPCITMEAVDARKFQEGRGGDVDPENCWYDWQLWRRHVGRKPDLDPGPKFNLIRSTDPAYQKAVVDARATLDQFRAMLPADGTPRMVAQVKTRIAKDKESAFTWLCNTRMKGRHFIAEFYEVPKFTNYQPGDRLEIAEDAIVDWMVNEKGVLHGGFSIRYHRSTLPEGERPAYDEYIGVTRYA